MAEQNRRQSGHSKGVAANAASDSGVTSVRFTSAKTYASLVRTALAPLTHGRLFEKAAFRRRV